MAVVQKESAYGFAGLPAVRQIGLMIGLAASIALGGAVVMWAKTPAYSLLYGNLSGTDSSRVMESLQQANIPYKIDDSSGAVLVPSGDVHKARLQLASAGLPKGSGIGFELFDKEQELGTSQFIEQARYQYALEIELARSIATMQNVRNVRVHLAIPKRTVFVRKKEKPSASVVLDLFSGRNLGDGQVAAIVHLVAAAIPNMGPEQVTVVDQHGTLLTSGMQSEHMALSSSQFEHTRRVESAYNAKIEDILTPIVGSGRVRAQVVADLDFTFTEKTQESYNPDLPALRSEQLIEEKDVGSVVGTSGVPGALSNQPAGEGVAGGALQRSGSGGKDNRRTTRNYELDKTISHTRSPTGSIRKLSVAVLIDDIQSVDDAGTVTRTPLSNEDITRYTALVKEAVGFDSTRGDSINVINATFSIPPPPEPLPEPAIWELPWMQNLLKQILGGVVVLLIVFGVLRPVLRSLAEKGAAAPGQLMAPQGMVDDQLTLGGGAGQQPAGMLAAAPRTVDQQIAAAQNMVAQDPARVAQVVKTWVETDG